MRVLGIESSCDETAASVFDGAVRSNVIASQIPVHARFGGVVPELASRAHVLDIVPTVQKALNEAEVTLEEIDAFAVTQGPGLVGSLLVGIQMAKALAYRVDKPLVGVNHIEAHLTAALLQVEEGWDEVQLPFVGLVVSGGHTSLYLVRAMGDYTPLGHTLDDAAGEALDKVGKMLGLGYPGGVYLDRLSDGGDPNAIRFPRGMKRRGNLDFSFSGLKTSVMTYLKREGHPEPGKALADFASSVQEAVADVLVSKSIWAAREHKAKSIVISGGVSANRHLRKRLQETAHKKGFGACVPPRRLCTDNAAMVAGLGHYYLKQSEARRFEGASMNARSNWSIVGS